MIARRSTSLTITFTLIFAFGCGSKPQEPVHQIAGHTIVSQPPV